MPHIASRMDDYPPRQDFNIYFLVCMPNSEQKAVETNEALASIISALKDITSEYDDYNTRINIMHVSKSITWKNELTPIDLLEFDWEDLPISCSPDFEAAMLNFNTNLSRTHFQKSDSGCLRPLVVFVTDQEIHGVEAALNNIWTNRWYRCATKLGFYTSIKSKESLEIIINNKEAVLDIKNMDSLLGLVRSLKCPPGRVAHQLPATDLGNLVSIIHPQSCDDNAVWEDDDSWD